MTTDRLPRTRRFTLIVIYIIVTAVLGSIALHSCDRLQPHLEVSQG